MTKSKGHWKSSFKLNPDTAFGFVYLITNLVDGRKYIGKKQYWSYSKGKKTKEMAWRTYTSSSKKLNADIKELGKSKFKFEILYECETKGGLTYLEANLQHKLDVLTERGLDSGERLWYNGNIGAIRFIPKERFEL